ncbi:Hypothetical predicted protein [Marmota monax]|uniref:Uncharacterized protein n=1 Tax=Marmota monax TaxID=9995 RepID=A0A5E4CKU7_MARMO|nr:Hypothetical predicted protein [Marmota monax]
MQTVSHRQDEARDEPGARHPASETPRLPDTDRLTGHTEDKDSGLTPVSESGTVTFPESQLLPSVWFTTRSEPTGREGPPGTSVYSLGTPCVREPSDGWDVSSSVRREHCNPVSRWRGRVPHTPVDPLSDRYNSSQSPGCPTESPSGTLLSCVPPRGSRVLVLARTTGPVYPAGGPPPAPLRVYDTFPSHPNQVRLLTVLRLPPLSVRPTEMADRRVVHQSWDSDLRPLNASSPQYDT